MRRTNRGHLPSCFILHVLCSIIFSFESSFCGVLYRIIYIMIKSISFQCLALHYHKSRVVANNTASIFAFYSLELLYNCWLLTQKHHVCGNGILKVRGPNIPEHLFCLGSLGRLCLLCVVSLFVYCIMIFNCFRQTMIIVIFFSW